MPPQGAEFVASYTLTRLLPIPTVSALLAEEDETMTATMLAILVGVWCAWWLFCVNWKAA